MRSQKIFSITTFTIFFVSIVSVLLAPPKLAEAALSVGGSYEACYENLKTEAVADIKAKKYVEKRRNTLKEINKEYIQKTRTNVDRFNQRRVTIETKTLPQLEALRTKGLVGEPANPEYAATPVPVSKTDINTLTNQYNSANDKVSAAEDVLSNSKSTRYQVVTSVCKAVHEGQVYNLVLPSARKVYTQSRIDVLYLNNYVHFTRANVARDVFDAKYVADESNSLESTDGDEIFLTADAYFIMAAEHFEQIEDDENALNSPQFNYAKTKQSITETRDQIKAILVDLDDPLKTTLQKPVKKERDTKPEKKKEKEKKKSEKKEYKPQYSAPKYTAPKTLTHNPTPKPKAKKPKAKKPKKFKIKKCTSFNHDRIGDVGPFQNIECKYHQYGYKNDFPLKTA